MAAGRTSTIAMERASTRNAATRRSVVWEPSVVIGNPFASFSYHLAARTTMNVRSRVIYSLSATLLLAGCGAIMERRVTNIDRKWAAGAIRHIEGREIDGAINNEAGSGNEITMNAAVRSRRKPKDGVENLGYFTTELNGDTLTIGRRDEHHGFFLFRLNNDTRVDYELRSEEHTSALQSLTNLV